MRKGIYLSEEVGFNPKANNKMKPVKTTTKNSQTNKAQVKKTGSSRKK